MKDCIFCRIINKEIPAHFIYEDEHVAAFLDVNPLVEGHTLVVPRKHFADIFDIDKEVLERIISVAKKISQKMKEVLGTSGVNLMNASGMSAEQSVSHFHLHIVPRKDGDNIDFSSWWQTKVKKLNEEKLKELASKLKI
jgi:histidine triad (HIT) family protein